MLDNGRKKGVVPLEINAKRVESPYFFDEVVLTGKKKSLMDETLQCLLYIVKSLEEVELPDICRWTN